MTYPVPTHAGFWWAKPRWKSRWVVVEILPRSLKGGLRACYFGTECQLSNFTFGPEVVKPEGLE